MRAGAEGAAIRLESCAKTFGDARVLAPVTLDISPGETVAFLGPSGCGKTTTLRIIAGLVRPDPGGRVLFDGEDVTAVPIERRNVGMVFQSYALFPNMSVAENIGYGLKIRRVSRAERERRVEEMLHLVSIEPLRDRRIDQLSGGQRQRVALARAVAPRPRVLLLDEPLTALDATLRERLRTDLNRLLRELRITAVYVTHDQAEAMTLGDRIAVMSNGAIAQVGPPEEVYFRPASRFVAEFVGAANILEGEAEPGGLHVLGGRIAVADAEGRGAAVAMVRPESIRVVDPGSATWHGRVASATFLGDRLRLVVHEAAGTPVTVDAPNRVPARVGDRVGLDVDASVVRLLPA